VGNVEVQERFQAAFNRGFQTRDAETNLVRFLGELDDGFRQWHQPDDRRDPRGGRSQG
jgi:hypothetical protein